MHEERQEQLKQMPTYNDDTTAKDNSRMYNGFNPIGPLSMNLASLIRVGDPVNGQAP